MTGNDFIKFLGTGGARVVLSKQLRSSGGIWVRLGKYNLLLDPGPGTLVRCWEGKPPLDPSTLDAILLTHRHLDHSSDLNVMVEAMAEGGYYPHGRLFVPRDALEGPEPVLFSYLKGYIEEIHFLNTRTAFNIGEITLEVPIRHHHPVETYGIKLQYRRKSIAYISDTRYFPGLLNAYKADTVIINMTFLKPYHGPGVFHLSSEEIIPLLTDINPQNAILTHFGRTVINVGPDKVAQELQEKTGIRVIAAGDGMVFSL